jgi:hypothetical protein
MEQVKRARDTGEPMEENDIAKSSRAIPYRGRGLQA